MTENFNMLIGKLVHGGYVERDLVLIPVPVAVESDSDEAWQDFQDSQLTYNKQYLASLHAPL